MGVAEDDALRAAAVELLRAAGVDGNPEAGLRLLTPFVAEAAALAEEASGAVNWHASRGMKPARTPRLAPSVASAIERGLWRALRAARDGG